MKAKSKKETVGQAKVFAFIDSQNLNLGTSKDLYRNDKLIYKGWKLDYKKFIHYLEEKFHVKKAFLFIGFIKQNEKLYQWLKGCGYELVFKPTVKDSSGKPKGNVDAELVLHSSAIQFTNYDRAVLVSGDGDFHCLIEYLIEKRKLFKIVIPNRHSESSLLRSFQAYKIFLDREREALNFKQ